MLLKMPRFSDELGGYSLLGLGDIALPGLFVSFTLRFDYMKRRLGCSSYFMIACIGYAVGLLFTMLALMIMKSGQVTAYWLVFNQS